MSTTPASPATPVTERNAVMHRFIPLNQIEPSPFNPRKHYDQAKLQELAASLRTSNGVLQPIVVRAKGEKNRYEIVVGERRWRAAKLVPLAEIEVKVVELSDREVAELQIIENSQRENVHPLEEADAFEHLLQIDTAYTTAAIAQRIGKSERYVMNRLHYRVLIEDVREAWQKDRINSGHADIIATLDPPDQKRALKACFDNLYGEDLEKGVISSRQLKAWKAANVRQPLAAMTREFPELQQAVEKATPEKPLLEVRGYGQIDAKLAKGLTDPSQYRLVRKGDKCDYSERAVIVLGNDTGQLVTVCRATDKCKLHWKYEIASRQRVQKAKATGRTKAAAAAEKKEADRRRQMREREERDRAVWDHIVEKVAPKTLPTTPTGALLKLIDWNHGGSGRIKTWRDLGCDELAEMGAHRLSDERGRVTGLLKGLGIDLVKVERELFPPAVVKPPDRSTPEKAAAVRKALAKKAVATRLAKRKAGKKR